MAELAFHVSPRPSRRSIREHGLDSRLAVYRPYGQLGDDSYEPGNYLHLLREQAFDMAQSLTEMDVWAVDVSGLNLYNDPQHPGVCASTPPSEPIAPERLTLLTSTDDHGDWEDQVDDPETWQLEQA